VRFTVVRVYPTCERVGSFRVRARAGVNRVKFRGRLRGRPLDEGTYRLLVRPRGARADAAALKLVVVRGAPLSAQELRAARDANVCGTSSAADGVAAVTALGWSPTSRATSGSVLGTTPSDRGSGGARDDDASAGSPLTAAGRVGRGAKTLGTRFTKALDDPAAIHPLVWGALALAILLLALAAIPAETLVTARAEALAYRRFEVALAGAGALAAAFFMYLIS
jgi:hypothetical protein